MLPLLWNQAHTNSHTNEGIIFSFIVFIQLHIRNNTYELFKYIFILLKNVTEEFPLLRLAGLDFLPVGSSVHEVGEGEFGPDVASELVWPQLAFTPHWKARRDGRGGR